MNSNINKDDLDWSVLDNPEIVRIAEAAAREVSIKFETTFFAFEDLLQEAYVILALNADAVKMHVVDGNIGLAHNALKLDLINLVEPEQKRAKRGFSYERAIEGVE